MYAFIEGQVCEKTANTLVLLAAGVGWQLSCSMTTLQAAPPVGETMRCHTYLSVREDAMELFGFATREEKDLFLLLTSVSGIGPKTALGVLGSMPVKDLSLAILLGDVNALSRAPGIGAKTAARIVLELQDKIGTEGQGRLGIPLPAVAPNLEEAQSALVTLGFPKQNVEKVLQKIEKEQGNNLSVEEFIKQALGRL